MARATADPGSRQAPVEPDEASKDCQVGGKLHGGFSWRSPSLERLHWAGQLELCLDLGVPLVDRKDPRFPSHTTFHGDYGAVG